MKKFSIHFITVLIIVLTVAAAARAAVFYVAVDGNDANDGSENSPFASIQKATDAAQAGDTVKVSAGIYLIHNSEPKRGMVIFRRSGTPEKPITFEAIGEVRVRGDGGVAEFGGIFEINGELSGDSQIHDLIVRGFRLENSNWFGIKIRRAKNIVVENNYTYNTGGSGILAIQSQNITVRGNTLEKACISPDTKIDTQEIISLSEVDGFKIDYNHVFNGGIVKGGNGGEGIDVKTGSRNGVVHHNVVHDLVRLGIYVDSWDRIIENISVYGNTVYNCAEGIAVSSESGGTARRIKIFNNVLYNNRNNGVIISAWVGNGARENIEIINNTIFNNGMRLGNGYDWGGGIAVETANAKNIIIRNNILSENKLWQISINDKSSDVMIDHNLIDTFRDFRDKNQREQRGRNYVQEKPQFVDPLRGNFRLKAGSPAIDRGDNTLAPENDFDSKPRRRNEPADIGAFEWKAV